jgi:Tat protein secretion system quality control protein TatD with DNase activity
LRCHPHFAHGWSKKVEELIEQAIHANRYQLQNNANKSESSSFFDKPKEEARKMFAPARIVAIGECGLDNSGK